MTRLRSTLAASALARQLAGGDPIRPIGEPFKLAVGVEPAICVVMLVIAWPDWMRRAHASNELFKVSRMPLGFVRWLFVAHLVTAKTAIGLDAPATGPGCWSPPWSHAVAARTGAGEQALVWNFHHRIPVDGRIIFRRSRCIGLVTAVRLRILPVRSAPSANPRGRIRAPTRCSSLSANPGSRMQRPRRRR